MAKDDYHVIVYQILAYLYQRLKKYEMGLITGVAFIDMDGLNVPMPAELNECIITPAGIEYLCDNSFMEKAKRFLKDVKEIVPFT